MATRSTSPRNSQPTDPQGELAESESFELVFARLDEISQLLEQGGLSLERSVDLYEEGMRLAQRCQDLLAGVEQRIETLKQRALHEDEPR